MPTKQVRLSAADRRSQLMSVARTVFSQLGYEATSIEEVARQAGVSKPIVYEHFGAKEGLYAAIVDREMESLVARVSEAIATGSSRERFEAAVRAFMTYVRDEPAGFAVLTRDSPIAQSRRGLTRVIDDLAERVTEVFASALKRAGQSPKLAPLFANALVGMVTQVGQWWAQSPRRLPIDQVAHHLADLGWVGMRDLPRRGPAPLRRG